MKKDLPLADHIPGEAVIENRTESTCTTAGSYDEVIYCSVCKTHEISRVKKALPLADHKDENGDGSCDICQEKLTEDEVETKVEIDHEFTDDKIPEELQQTQYDTVEKIEIELNVQIQKQDVVAEESVLYDAVLMYREADGLWQRADEIHFPANGKLSVTLNVPAGTSPETHRYHAAHMFTSSAFGKVPGDVETFEDLVAVPDGKGGYCVTIEVTGLSPILVAAEKIPLCADGHSLGTAASQVLAAEATCTEAAYYFVKCDNCDEVSTYLTVTVGDPMGHAYVGVVTTEPTCTEAGVKTYTCSHDPAHTYTEVLKAVGHSFGEYESDGNATCKTDGTKTALCENGCGTKDTVTDKGSKLGHKFVNGKCIRCNLSQSNAETGDRILIAAATQILSGGAILMLLSRKKKNRNF